VVSGLDPPDGPELAPEAHEDYAASVASLSEQQPLTEIVFIIEEDPDGGYSARALGQSIYTEADTYAALKDLVRDAVRCHFPNVAERPRMIRLHFIRDELIAA
jgi:hypothetical protein